MRCYDEAGEIALKDMNSECQGDEKVNETRDHRYLKLPGR